MEPTPEQLAEIRDQVLAPFPSYDGGILGPKLLDSAARLSYQAGADARLEACLASLSEDILTKENLFGAGIGSVNSLSWKEFALMVCIQLRSAMRPKPPSLKQQALEALRSDVGWVLTQEEWGIVVRAVESLPDD
jgi:hypothetical protein